MVATTTYNKFLSLFFTVYCMSKGQYCVNLKACSAKTCNSC